MGAPVALHFNGHLPKLQDAFEHGRLSLYLGAGVSRSSGLPSWPELVQALYFTTLNDESFIYELRPYPNYLFALAEWVLEQKNEPLDIQVAGFRVPHQCELGRSRFTTFMATFRSNLKT
jgi:hypothetical protein